MTGMVLAFAGGVVAGAMLLAGPGLATWAAAALVLAALARARWVALGLGFVIGLAHFEAAMQRYLDRRDALLADAGPRLVTGVVGGLPDCGERGCAFDFWLEASRAPVRAFWGDPAGALGPGQRLTLEVSLSPQWSLRNPGGFDRETWALGRGVHAAARVVGAHESPSAPPAGAALDRFRLALGARLGEALSGAPAAPLLKALAIGDRRDLSERHWDVLQRTGTAHLLAISGLHIGLVAGLAFLSARLIYRLLPVPRFTRQHLAAALAALAAAGYAALAGFALPTVRALIMLAVPLAALALRRSVSGPQGLIAALAAVLAVDPLASLQRGFWLSFGAVAVLLWVTRGCPGGNRVGRALRPQWAVFVGLFPVLAATGLPHSVLAPLVNAVAIPWVSVAVLPPLFAGLIALPWAAPLAEPALRLSAAALELLWQGLRWLAELPLAPVRPGATALPVALALVGAVLLLAPRGWPGRAVALVLFTPLLVPVRVAPPVDAAWLHVLDVGQGTAAVVQTHSRALLYDAGPGWEAGWNAGRGVIVPFLAARGLERPGRIVISHADSDHAGGLAGLEPIPVDATLTGSSPDRRWPRCLAGERWGWDGVDFEVLHPGRWLPYLGNDSSCVLMVRAGAGRLLLTGDIGAAVERRLQAMDSKAALISVPHHGSKSSSTEEFLAAVGPRLAVVSAGQGNRFRMPHAETVARYARHGIGLLSTAECGYLRIALGPGPEPRLLHAERAAGGRPWHQPARCFTAQTGR